MAEDGLYKVKVIAELDKDRLEKLKKALEEVVANLKLYSEAFSNIPDGFEATIDSLKNLSDALTAVGQESKSATEGQLALEQQVTEEKIRQIETSDLQIDNLSVVSTVTEDILTVEQQITDEKERQVEYSNQQADNSSVASEKQLSAEQKITAEKAKQAEHSNANAANTEKQTAANETQSKQASKLGQASAAIGNSLKALGPAMLAFKIFEDIIDKVAGEIKKMVNTLLSGLMPALQPITDIIGLLTRTLKPIFDQIFGTLRVVLDQIGSKLEEIIKALKPLMDAIIGALAPVFDTLIAVVDTILKSIDPKAFQALIDVLVFIVTLVGKILEITMPILAIFIEWAVKLNPTIITLQLIGELVTLIEEGIVLVKEGIAFIEEGFVLVKEKVLSVIEKVQQMIAEVQFIRKFIALIEEGFALVKEKVLSVIEKMQQIFEIVQPVVKFIALIAEGFDPMVQKLQQMLAIVALFIPVYQAIILAAQAINSLFGDSNKEAEQVNENLEEQNKNLREQQVAINKSIAAQDKLLQSQMEGNRLKEDDIKGQKELLAYLKERHDKNGKYTEEEMKQRQKARALISKDNIAAINELREQFEEGKNIEEGFAEQKKRLEELNGLKRHGVKLSREEKQELQDMKSLQKEIADKAKEKINAQRKTEELEAKYGALNKERQKEAIQNIDTLTQRVKIYQKQLAEGKITDDTYNSHIATLDEKIEHEKKLIDKGKEKNKKEFKDLTDEIALMQLEYAKQSGLFNASLIADTYERKKEELRINKEYDDKILANKIKAVENDKQIRAEQKTQMIAELKNEQQLLFAKQIDANNKLVKEQAINQIKTEIAAQKKIFDERKKLYDMQLKNSQGMDKDEIQRRYELRLQLVQDATKKEIDAIVQADEEVKKAQEAYQEAILKNEANRGKKFWLPINTEILKKKMDDAIEVVKTGNKQIEAAQEDGANQEKELTKKTQKELEDLRIQGISNTIQRTLELEIQAIEEKFAKEIEQYKGNPEIIERLEKEKNKAIRNAQIESAKQNMTATTKILEDGLKNMKNAIASTFEAKNKGEKELESMRKNHKDQENELRAALNRREIDEQEYHQRIAELTEQAAEEQAAKREEINQAQRESFVNLFGDMSSRFSETAAKIGEDMLKLGGDSEAMGLKMGEAMAAVGGVFASTLASSLADGQSFMKSMAMSVLSALQAMIPIFVAQIYAVNTASPKNILLPGWGIAEAALVTAALQGLVEIAKQIVSSLNFYKGGLVTQGYRTHDSVDAKVAKGEFIVNNKAVSKGNNLEILRRLNDSNIDIVDIFRNEYLKTEAQQLKFIRSLDWDGTRRMNEIITSKHTVNFNIENTQIANEIRATNKEIKKTNKKMDAIIEMFESNNFVTNKMNTGIKQLNSNSKNVALETKLVMVR